MLNTTQANEVATVKTHNLKIRHWLRVLVAVLREHALSHRAATAAALHRRSADALRKLYVRAQTSGKSTQEPVRTVTGHYRPSTGRPYFVPSRHSFGK